VAQTRVEHFFHAAEFGAPQIAHVVEAAVDGVEPRGDMRGNRPNIAALNSMGTPMAR